MATSGSTNYNPNRTAIITRAYRICQAVALGEAPSAPEMAAGVEALQGLVKHWNAIGVHLWKTEELNVFLTVGTEKYTLGTSGDRAAFEADTKITKLNGAHVITETALIVDSTTGMTAADVIGVVLTDGTTHWTTIVSVDSATGLTITTGLLTAASDNGVVYTYTTAITTRPLIVIDGRWRVHTGTNPIDTPFADVLSRDEYYDLPQKKSQGPATQAFYDAQLEAGTLHLFPAPDTASAVAQLTVKMPIEDMDAIGDTMDFPQEWVDALTFNLAARMSIETGVPKADRDDIKLEAFSLLDDMRYFDVEPVSLQLQPAVDWSEE